MRRFLVAAEVVVAAEVLVVPAGALAEVAIAVLAVVGVQSGIRAADGRGVQGHVVRPPEGQAARPPEGQALLGGPRTTVRYATVPRLGPLCLDVPAKPVVK